MYPRLVRSALLKLCVLCLSTFVPVSFAFAQGSREPKVTNIVLVHGAWADGSSWERVIPLLQLSGYHVTAVHLPLSSLAEDVAATRRAIAFTEKEHPGPILLVGHSYGGAVITEAGDDPNVVGLLYVAAFAPGPGESVGSISEPYGLTPGLKGAYLDLSSSYYVLPKDVLLEDFAQDVDRLQANILASVEAPTAARVFADPITSAAWASKPSWYIVASQDRIISPELERALAAKMQAKTLVLHSSHVPMLSQPLRVCLFIEEATRSLTR